MSRTYRRRHDSAPDWVINEYKYSCVYSCYIYERVPYTGKALKREIAKWHSDSGWHSDYGSTPGWWRTLWMEVPHRARTKNALKHILRLEDYEDANVCPMYKRPQEYYW